MVTVTFQCESVKQLRIEMMDFLSAKAQETFPIAAPTFVEPHPKMTDKIDPKKYGADKIETHEAPVKGFDINVTAPAPAAPEKSEPEKRKRRTKAEIEAEKAAKSPGGDVFAQDAAAATAAQPEAAPAETQVKNVAPPLVSKETVHQALQQVTVAAGLPKAREILQEFKVNRISEIQEKDFKAFIEKCNEATMMA